MAEVRAIPSAVGAFEAQVLNTSSAYAYLMKNAAEQKKQSAALRKQIDESLNTALSDNRIVRAQDSPYITNLKKDLENYFSQNKNAIYEGGAELNEYKNKMGNVASEITRSLALKERGIQLYSYAKNAVDPTKGTTYSKAFSESLSIFDLPMNDKRRIDYTFTNDAGMQVGIDLLGINELDRFAYYKPERLDDAIRNIRSYNYKTTSKSGDKDLTRYYSYKSPNEIYNAVLNTGITFPDMADTYSKQSIAEQTLFAGTDATLEQRMNKQLKNMNDFYVKSGAGEILSLFQKNDNKVGVDVNNPFEYALYQKLFSNMPKDLGNSYDYKSSNHYLAVEQLKMQKENQVWKRAQETSLDGLIIQDVKDGKFNPIDWENVINAFVSQQESTLGNIKTGEVSFSQDGNSMIVTTFKPLYNPDGTIVTDRNAADRILKEGKGQGSGRAAAVTALPGGLGYGAKEITTIDIDKTRSGWETRIVNGMNILGESIINDTTKKSFEQARKNTSKNLIEELSQ